MLQGAPYNPRKINKVQAKRLRDGLKVHGLVGGILWNKRTGNLVGGHQRIQQLDQLEGSQDYAIEVDVIDVDEFEEREINVLLNNPTAQGEFDHDKLAEVIGCLRENDRNVERTGFTMADMQGLLGDMFLDGEMADQRDDESDTLAALAEIRSIGRDAEDEFFGVDEAVEDQERISTTVPTPPPKKDYTEELKRRKEELMAENSEKEEADYMIHLVFPDSAARDYFLKHFKLPNKRYLDRFEIEAAFNIDLK